MGDERASFFCLLRVVVPVHQVLCRGLPGLHPTLTPQTPPKVEGRWQWTPAWSVMCSAGDSVGGVEL